MLVLCGGVNLSEFFYRFLIYLSFYFRVEKIFNRTHTLYNLLSKQKKNQRSISVPHFKAAFASTCLIWYFRCDGDRLLRGYSAVVQIHTSRSHIVNVTDGPTRRHGLETVYVVTVRSTLSHLPALLGSVKVEDDKLACVGGMTWPSLLTVHVSRNYSLGLATSAVIGFENW